MWRWLLPLILAGILVGYESLEHVLMVRPFVSASLWWELFLFGMAGPVAVWYFLNWITAQVRARVQAEEQLQQLVEQLRQAEDDARQANVALEQKVAERTQELLDAYQKVADQNEALKTLDRLKSEFVSLVSHELRAPLTNINGGLELILAFGDGLEPDVYDSLQVMEQESARLTRLVEKILNVSALEAGQLRLNVGPVALPPLIERSVAGHRHESPEYSFSVDIQDRLPMVLADETCLYNTLYNLVENAVKYTPQSVEGEIKVAAGYNGAMDIGKDGLISISVIDNGPGISAEDQKKIFDPFYRANDREDREVYGYGLGLYFARKLVEAQGGTICVESQPGRGSCFTLTLPAAPLTDLEEEVGDETDNFTGR